MSDIADIVCLWLGRQLLKAGRYLVQRGGATVTPITAARKPRARPRTTH